MFTVAHETQGLAYGGPFSGTALTVEAGIATMGMGSLTSEPAETAN